MLQVLVHRADVAFEAARMRLVQAPGAGRTHPMSVASFSFTAVVLTPLLLLVIDLFGRKAPTPAAPPARGAQRR
jgi:hypothetical protein